MKDIIIKHTKDIIIYTLFYLVWNTPVLWAHPTLIPVFLTLAVVCNIIEFINIVKTS